MSVCMLETQSVCACVCVCVFEGGSSQLPEIPNLTGYRKRALLGVLVDPDIVSIQRHFHV